MLLFRISTDWLQHQFKSFSREGKIDLGIWKLIVRLNLGSGQCHGSSATPRQRRTGTEGAEEGEVLQSRVCGLCYCLGETNHKIMTCRGFLTSRSCHATVPGQILVISASSTDLPLFALSGASAGSGWERTFKGRGREPGPHLQLTWASAIAQPQYKSCGCGRGLIARHTPASPSPSTSSGHEFSLMNIIPE